MSSPNNVIVFEPKMRGKDKQDAKKPGRSAQVIIYPGIRIERREFALGDRQPTKPGTFTTREKRTKRRS
ncbi:MAG: hypothetical protein ACR2OJ_16320 [Hyphomicrobiales bacterium]